MAKKKRKKTTKSQTVSSNQNAVMVFFFSVALLLAAYLYGKVQIHVDLKKIDHIKSEVRTLKQKRNNLRIRVNALKGYQHVVSQAKKQGLVFVKSDRLDKLRIQANPGSADTKRIKENIFCAGMAL